MSDLTPEQLDEIERRARSDISPLLTKSAVLSLIAEVRRLRAGVLDGVLQVERTTLTAALVYLTAEINQYRSKSNVPPRIRRAQELLESVLRQSPRSTRSGRVRAGQGS